MFVLMLEVKEDHESLFYVRNLLIKFLEQNNCLFFYLVIGGNLTLSNFLASLNEINLPSNEYDRYHYGYRFIPRNKSFVYLRTCIFPVSSFLQNKK